VYIYIKQERIDTDRLEDPEADIQTVFVIFVRYIERKKIKSVYVKYDECVSVCVCVVCARARHVGRSILHVCTNIIVRDHILSTYIRIYKCMYIIFGTISFGNIKCTNVFRKIRT